MRPVTDIPRLKSLGWESGRKEVNEEELQREIVATNEMDIIKASALSGKLDVKHVRWNEGEEVPQAGYWWRWRWDICNWEAS